LSALIVATTLGRQVEQLARNAREYRLILDRVDNPLKPACKDFRIWLKRDYRQAEGLIRKLKRAHEHPDNDLLTRLAIAEQLRVAAQAEAELKAVQLERMEGRP
jgi:hypothetical protein